jgi:phosphatidylinositol alpha-mannosyltransferase
MEKHRGVEELLAAMSELLGTGADAVLELVGDGRDYDAFRRRAAELGLSAPRVVFHGRLPHADAIAVIRRGHVGVVPHHARESWNTTISNKQFDYMAAGLAVVSSDAAPAARVVNDTGAGLVFRSGDSHDLAVKLARLLDIETWEQCRRLGREAVLSQYNWESATRVLLDVVARVAAAEKA